MSSAQWLRLLKNVGIWQGSFTQFSPNAQLVKNTPSELKLEGLNDNQSIKITVTKFDGNSQPYVNEFTYLNRSTFFFAEGHFAKGSSQFSPYSIFGAEYGFLRDNRRCRMVQIYDNDGNLKEVTLIREFRKDSNAQERPPLLLAQLLGEWAGKAETLSSDWRNSDPYPTRLKVEKQGSKVVQTLTTPQFNLTSTGTINDSYLSFNDSGNEIRVLLLPDGASATLPLKINNRQPFFLEFAWLVEPNQRLRLIRQYDQQGVWSNITLVGEYKVK